MLKLLAALGIAGLALIGHAGAFTTLADRLMSVQNMSCSINEITAGTNFFAGGGGGSQATLSVAAPGGGIPSGSLIVVGILDLNSAAGSVSDGTNTYAAGIAGTLSRLQTFYAFNTAAITGGTNITYTTATDNSNPVTMSVFYASGIATASPYDSAVAATAAGVTGGTPAITVTSGTPAQAGELIVAFAAWNFGAADTFTQPSGFSAPPPAYLTQRPLVGGSLVNAGTGTETYAITPANAVGGQSIYASIIGFKRC